MEKKYIVELGDENVRSADGYDWLQLLISVAYKPVMVETPIQLLPYSEPDTEKVRKESCDKCMNEVEDLAYQLYSLKVDEAYQRGLNNVWEAVKRLNNMPYETTKKIFGCGFGNVLDTLTASEFIERITEYEQKQVKFCAGDEICHKAIPEIKVCVTGSNRDGNWDGFTVDHYSAENIGHVYASRSTEDWMKTGKHYPQIAEMLRKTTTERDDERDREEKVHT